MNEFVAGVVRAAAETFDFPSPILEVGSYRVDGQEQIANLRGYFPGKQYTGIDFRSGPGVDCVENVEELDRSDHSVGSVIAMNVFEHVERFWLGFKEVQRVLRMDGILLISCPFHFHIHENPKDYWRFTPETYLSLLNRVPARIVGFQGPKDRPLQTWVIATGTSYPAISSKQYELFRALLRRYARQPLPWETRIRYRIGSVLCGRGPLAPYLDGDCFETTWLGGP